MWFQLALSASILWGLSYALCEKIFQSYSASYILALDMLFGSLFFLLAYPLKQAKTEWQMMWSNKNMLALISLEVLIFSLANYLICQAIQNKDNNVVVALVESCYPLYSLIFTWLLFNRNHLNWQTGIGGLMIIIGVTLVSRS